MFGFNDGKQNPKEEMRDNYKMCTCVHHKRMAPKAIVIYYV